MVKNYPNGRTVDTYVFLVKLVNPSLGGIFGGVWDNRGPTLPSLAFLAERIRSGANVGASSESNSNSLNSERYQICE